MLALLLSVAFLSSMGSAASRPAARPSPRPAAPAARLPAKPLYSPDGEMALVPAGEFWMGSPENSGNFNEEPRHLVRLRSFWLDKTEVTVGQYRAFSRAIGREMEPPVWNRQNLPVHNVSWEDAQAYCEWARKRLPTEAEWEKAARGGADTKFSFGDSEEELDDYAWHAGNAMGRPHPVGQKKPNAYGLYDMYGNMWEWVADYYAADYYNRSPKEDPAGPPDGQMRVLRGGSWKDDAASTRPAARHWNGPSAWNMQWGFRCARSVRR